MATSLTSQEQVMFDNVMMGLEDLLVIAKGAELYNPLTPQEAVHAQDKFWLPCPMIGASYDGFDQSANFDGLTQLNVPCSVGYHKSVPKNAEFQKSAQHVCYGSVRQGCYAKVGI